MKYRIKQKISLDSTEKIISNIFYIQKKILFLWARAKSRTGISNYNVLTFSNFEDCKEHYDEMFTCKNEISYKNKKIFTIYNEFKIFDWKSHCNFAVCFSNCWFYYGSIEKAKQAIDKNLDEQVKSTKIKIIDV